MRSYFKERAIEHAKEKWFSHAKLREGYRNDVYKDSLGKLTVGIGHLVLPKDKLKFGEIVSDKWIMDTFEKDTEAALRVSVKQAYELGQFDDPCKYNSDFLAALISVNFQFGDWSKVFYSSYPLLVKGNYKKVVSNLKKSLWYRQTPVRVEDFIKAIEKAYA